MYHLVMQVRLLNDIIFNHLQLHDLRAQMKGTICLNMICSVNSTYSKDGCVFIGHNGIVSMEVGMNKQVFKLL
jgi:hypothetical protein